ncbi:conjugative transfer signal peptidase TraF [Desulfobulbus elongatus]|uniref:conjugative transfer signal peptidase TraF n=1 Tax=Desulfobulbus elongatus TaxID=53332 RepID=UPI00048489C9|nr:conjugative transfer signal peptidase TraF [Desulfobulbus elongatus]
MKSFYAVSLVLSAVMLWGWYAGYRINITASMPRGLYRIASGPPYRDAFVFFCLESSSSAAGMARERGYLAAGSCPSGLRPLLKQVAGLPGDRLEMDDHGLAVNGQRLLNSRRAETDSAGRSMPAASLIPGVIPPGKALVLSRYNAGSFDSRYFGLIPLAAVRPVQPVLLTQP